MQKNEIESQTVAQDFERVFLMLMLLVQSKLCTRALQ